MRIHFARNEEMRTEISTKFTRERLEASYADAGLELVEWWTDPDELYALSLAAGRVADCHSAPRCLVSICGTPEPKEHEMKVFVAAPRSARKAAGSAPGRSGHEVVGMTRSDSGRAGRGSAPSLRADAPTPRPSVRRQRGPPEVIVHQLTALSGSLDLRHFDRDFARPTACGPRHGLLLSAAGRGGAPVRRPGSPAGRLRVRGPIKTEDDPLDPDPPAAVRTTLEAIRHLERAVTGCGADRGARAPLRAASTGPARRSRLDPPAGEHVEAIRGRKFPIVGGGGGVWSFVHIEDAAEATVDRGRARRAGHLQRRRRPPVGGPRLAAGDGARDSARSGRCGCRAGSAGSWPARRRR